MKKLYWYLLISASLLTLSCNDSNDKDADAGKDSGPAYTTPAISYSIMNTHPHDTSYFTEGLEFYNNTLLESTGLNGKSKLVQYDLASGKVVKEISLDPKFFGEGITVLHDTVYQLTYQEHMAFLYSVKDFKKLKEIPFNVEGWGMTNDGKTLIATNGSSNLYFYEPGTLKLLRIQAVTDNGAPVTYLNELEYVDGFLYANQWQTNNILKINPATGEIVGKLDLTNIVNQARQDGHAEFLNGIAYNPLTKKFYVTGKLWPQIFEITFSH
jgi:glutamine cyclotransferase